MSVTIDYTDEAISLYSSIAKQYDLEFYIERNKYGESFVILPKQNGLNFKISLGLTSGDEAHIGMQSLCASCFPFPKVKDFLEETVIGLLNGSYCLAQYSQFGRVTKRQIENPKGRAQLTELVSFRLPFFKVERTETRNNLQNLES